MVRINKNEITDYIIIIIYDKNNTQNKFLDMTTHKNLNNYKYRLFKKKVEIDNNISSIIKKCGGVKAWNIEVLEYITASHHIVLDRMYLMSEKLKICVYNDESNLINDLKKKICYINPSNNINVNNTDDILCNKKINRVREYKKRCDYNYDDDDNDIKNNDNKNNDIQNNDIKNNDIKNNDISNLQNGLTNLTKKLINSQHKPFETITENKQNNTEITTLQNGLTKMTHQILNPNIRVISVNDDIINADKLKQEQELKLKQEQELKLKQEQEQQDKHKQLKLKQEQELKLKQEQEQQDKYKQLKLKQEQELKLKLKLKQEQELKLKQEQEQQDKQKQLKLKQEQEQHITYLKQKQLKLKQEQEQQDKHKQEQEKQLKLKQEQEQQDKHKQEQEKELKLKQEQELTEKKKRLTALKKDEKKPTITQPQNDENINNFFLENLNDIENDITDFKKEELIIKFKPITLPKIKTFVKNSVEYETDDDDDDDDDNETKIKQKKKRNKKFKEVIDYEYTPCNF